MTISVIAVLGVCCVAIAGLLLEAMRRFPFDSVLVRVVRTCRKHRASGECSSRPISGEQVDGHHIGRACQGGNYEPGRPILRLAQLLRSTTVKRSRNELALTIFSRLARPVASALAITEAASASSSADKIATAPAPPAKCAK